MNLQKLNSSALLLKIIYDFFYKIDYLYYKVT